MLAYHAAQDSYHSAFRMLRILSFDSFESYEPEKLRILDFYLLFPELIQDIRLSSDQISAKRAVSPPANKYHLNRGPKEAFRQMWPLQNTATKLLLSTELVEKSENEISLGVREIPSGLLEQITERNEAENDLMTFLVRVVGDYSLSGRNGLKDRTRLLEYRYDVD